MTAAGSYYEQGDLDGLCGIYAVINAVDIMVNDENLFCEEKAKSLFHEIALTLPKNLAHYVYYGMKGKDVLRALKFIQSNVKYYRKIEIEPLRVKSLPEFWKNLDRHFKNRKSPVVVLKMREKCETSDEEGHWTCAIRMNEDTLFLADSDERAPVEKSECRIGKNVSRKYRKLYPRQTWLLHVRE